jgi:hypothetical protein
MIVVYESFGRITSPALFVSGWCAPTWFRHHRRDAVLMCSTAATLFLMMSSYAIWSAGACYSSRYLVPILPLLFVPLAMLAVRWQSRGPRRLCATLIALSLVFGDRGVRLRKRGSNTPASCYSRQLTLCERPRCFGVFTRQMSRA